MARAMQTVGIIGTGEIGWRMGKLLLAAGHAVVGYDIRREALERPKQSGFELADSTADLCRRSDIVLSCVTDGAALHDVVTGPSGVAANLAAGKPYIDTTSAEPWITIDDVAPLLKSNNIPFLDAPVSGGVPAAEAGRMNFMVGGDAALLDRCRPLLQHLGPVITHVGAIGSGHTIKAINMLALAASMLSTSELTALGLAAGLTLDEIVTQLEAGAGASYSTRIHFPRFIVPGNYGSGFSFDLMYKDLSIGTGLADRLGVPLILERTTFELYRAAANTGIRGQDNTRIVERILAQARGQSINDGTGLLARIERLAAACNMLVAAETICLGLAAGLKADTIIDVISASSGDSRGLRDVAAYLEDSGNAPSLGQVRTAALPTIADALDAAIPMPLVMHMAAVLATAIGRFGGEADSRSLLKLVAEWTKQREGLPTMESAGGSA